MTDLRIDAEDFRRAADALTEAGFEKVAGKTVASSLRGMGNAVRKHVRAAVRPHRKTGKLAGNVRVRFQARGVRSEARVRAEGPIAHLIAGGVKPHTIAPGKVMPIHVGGRIVAFSQVVEHPGFGADPFFARGVRESQGDINRIAQTAIDTMASELASRLNRR